MKNIMITGGAGFIGTNFIKYVLNETDFDGMIINIDILTDVGNKNNLKDIDDDSRYSFHQLDICNYEGIEGVIQEHKVDTIVNFAASTHVDRSITNPLPFVQTNIVGTFTLLELAKKYNLRFHQISTDEVFGSIQSGLFTEESPYAPNSPYSASKASADHLVRSYNKTYDLPTTISVCTNNYGPYQFPEKLIPVVIHNCLHRLPIPVYGTGRNVRDWIYVRDNCIAIWSILQKGTLGDTYCIGGNTEVSNINLVEIICEIFDKTLDNTTSSKELITYVEDRAGHDFRYAIDSSKIRHELNWKPEGDFETKLVDTIGWYLMNLDWVDTCLTNQEKVQK